jgi:Flp pilus assembly protein TadG
MSRESPPSTVGAWPLQTAKRPKFGRFLRLRAASKAQTTVEFSLIIAPFFAILFAMIDYANVYYYDNSLQNALREAARFATAGRIIQNSNAYVANGQGVEVPLAITDSEGRVASRNECIRYWFQSNCVIHVPITNIVIYSATVVNGQPPLTSTNNGVLHLVSGFTTNANGSTTAIPAVPGPGNANDYVEIVCNYSIGTITPIFRFLGGYDGRAIPGGYNLRVSAIVKNEPAMLNFLHTNMYSDEPNESATQQSQ